MPMAGSVRLRVVFRDAGLLKRSQRRRGLQKCLVQLRPDVATIADLAAQLHQNFGLHRSCPHGLIISMDDFVLPPFESTSILKDDDMIMVNKSGVVFEDAVKFCGNQRQEQVLQSRDLAHSNQKLAVMDEIIDPIVVSGDKDDIVLCDESAARMETPQSEKIKRCKRKRSIEFQSSDNTLAIKDSYGDSRGDGEDISRHVNRKHTGATSNEMVNANCKKKHTNKFRASVSTLDNKDSQANSQGDKAHLTLPIRHKETSSGAMIQGKQNKKHFNEFQGSDDTLTIEGSQGNSQSSEHDDVLGVTADKEATSEEIMNSKRLNKLQASNTLTSKDSQADSQGDEEDLGLPTEKRSQEETPPCKMTNTKRKKKHSLRHHGSKINKNGVVFEDDVKFHGNQYQKQVLQSRDFVHNNQKLAIMDEIVDPIVISGDEDMVLCNGSAARMKAPESEKIKLCKQKRSNELQSSDNTLAIKNSHGDSLGDAEDISLHGNKKHKGATSNEMVKANCVKKQTNKFRASDSMLENADSQSDSQGDIGHLTTLPIQHKETSSGEMIQGKQNEELFHKLQGSDDALTTGDSQGNSQRDQHDVGLLRIRDHKEATSKEMPNLKHKRERVNKLQASNTLTNKDTQADSQDDEEDLGLPNEKKPQEETPSCEMTRTKLKKKHSHRHQGSNNTWAIANSQGDVAVIEDDRDLPNRINEPAKTPSEMTNVFKRRQSNKLELSENKTKGIFDVHASMNVAKGDERKMSSRSARRKKAKKIFYRTHGLKIKMAYNKEVDQSSQNLNMPISQKLIEIPNPERDNHEEPSDNANADQNTDVNIGIVPIVVRPGHIRFESSDEQSAREDDPVDTFQWNGTTSKKKGQKWGREKNYNKWNDVTFYQVCNGESDTKGADVVEVLNEIAAVEEVESHKDSIAEQVEPVLECEENTVSEELEAGKQLIDYESFLPLTRLPENGDLLVYRLVELSSSWCPELSNFRVGRVSLYDPCSSKIILLPLPEYPVMSEETPDEGHGSVSLYAEDGTLEIDFSSLVDVRLFKSHESEVTHNTPIEETQKAAPVNNQESDGVSDHTANEQHLGDGWEAIQRALDEKKAHLQKRNKFENGRDSSGRAETGPWSYKALRRNAVGPTLAMLRSSNADCLEQIRQELEGSEAIGGSS